jgi:hypothetical protein
MGVPRYGTPGGIKTFSWLVNEHLPDECIVYAPDAIAALDLWMKSTWNARPSAIWGIRFMSDNE